MTRTDCLAQISLCCCPNLHATGAPHKLTSLSHNIHRSCLRHWFSMLVSLLDVSEDDEALWVKSGASGQSCSTYISPSPVLAQLKHFCCQCKTLLKALSIASPNMWKDPSILPHERFPPWWRASAQTLRQTDSSVTQKQAAYLLSPSKEISLQELGRIKAWFEWNAAHCDWHIHSARSEGWVLMQSGSASLRNGVTKPQPSLH